MQLLFFKHFSTLSEKSEERSIHKRDYLHNDDRQKNGKKLFKKNFFAIDETRVFPFQRREYRAASETT
jgi:hypothetical protein